MKSDDLINILSATPPVTRAPINLFAFSAITVLLSAALIMVTYGVRPDILLALSTAHFWYKSLFLLALSACSAYALKQSFRPDGHPDHFLNLLCGLWIMTTILSMLEVFFADRNLMERALIAPKTAFCMGYITSIGLIAMGALTVLARHFAPTNLKQTATLIGFSSGVFIALGYSFHCMADFGSYLLVAYGLPILLLTYIGRTILPRFLKW